MEWEEYMNRAKMTLWNDLYVKLYFNQLNYIYAHALINWE